MHETVQECRPARFPVEEFPIKKNKYNSASFLTFLFEIVFQLYRVQHLSLIPPSVYVVIGHLRPIYHYKVIDGHGMRGSRGQRALPPPPPPAAKKEREGERKREGKGKEEKEEEEKRKKGGGGERALPPSCYPPPPPVKK